VWQATKKKKDIKDNGKTQATASHHPPTQLSPCRHGVGLSLLDGLQLQLKLLVVAEGHVLPLRLLSQRYQAAYNEKLHPPLFGHSDVLSLVSSTPDLALKWTGNAQNHRGNVQRSQLVQRERVLQLRGTIKQSVRQCIALAGTHLPPTQLIALQSAGDAGLRPLLLFLRQKKFIATQQPQALASSPPSIPNKTAPRSWQPPSSLLSTHKTAVEDSEQGGQSQLVVCGVCRSNVLA
jgi:hypothetical protein